MAVEKHFPVRITTAAGFCVRHAGQALVRLLMRLTGKGLPESHISIISQQQEIHKSRKVCIAGTNMNARLELKRFSALISCQFDGQRGEDLMTL